jgi:hypothetical protein
MAVALVETKLYGGHGPLSSIDRRRSARSARLNSATPSRGTKKWIVKIDFWS